MIGAAMQISTGSLVVEECELIGFQGKQTSMHQVQGTSIISTVNDWLIHSFVEYVSHFLVRVGVYLETIK